ncbi:MAG: hypothetical protein M3442_21880 [Chloroflexota bacterium]|nr:hypothetical protein [Chloroflexota bacterium]
MAGARTPAGGHADFPAAPSTTLQPGQQHTYRQARTFAVAGTAWPAFFDGAAWRELAPARISFTVRPTGA